MKVLEGQSWLQTMKEANVKLAIFVPKSRWGCAKGQKRQVGRAWQRPLTWVLVLRKLRPLWLTARIQGAGTVMLLQLWMKKKEEPNKGKALRRPVVWKACHQDTWARTTGQLLP